MRFVIVLAVVVLVVAAVVSAEEDGKKDRSASKKHREHGKKKDREHGSKKDREHGSKKDREHGKKDREHGSKKDREHGSKKDREHGKKDRSHIKKHREHSAEKEREHKGGKSASERAASFELREREARTLNLPHNMAARSGRISHGKTDREYRHHEVDPSKLPEPCKITGQIRVCNNPCVSLTCDNYDTEAVNWTDCIYEKPNGIVQAIADECYHGKGTWSECFCHPGYVMDDVAGICVRQGYCSQKGVTPTTTTTEE